MTWLPWGTQPEKPEMIILGWRKDMGVLPLLYTATLEDGVPDDDDHRWFDMFGYSDLTNDPPTHWMPLPNEPGESL